MTGLRRSAHLGFLFLISSHLLHLSSAQNQKNQHQPSTIPDIDVSKPGWSWTMPPGAKPEEHKNHHHGDGGGKREECNCNCNCDCQKTECKSNEHERGPVVCLPMTCDGVKGCHFGGGMNVEAANTFQIPQFTVAGLGQNGQRTSPAEMNATDTEHQ
ncbi:hypothetical protein SOVF_210590 [Spinacia oleracea]|nr:hypothetical protein SOVF_210590 [Spinacia oleracea]